MTRPLPHTHRDLAGRLLRARVVVPGAHPGRATIIGGGVARTFALQAHAVAAPARTLAADAQTVAARAHRPPLKKDRP